MYEIGVEGQFESAHRLVGPFGPATRTHGHTYRLEVVVQGPALRADNTLCDVGLLRAAVDELAATLNYRDLDEVEGLAGANSTVEAVASHCWQVLATKLAGNGLSSLLVRVWESPQVFAARHDTLAGE